MSSAEAPGCVPAVDVQEALETYRDEASFLWTQRQDALEAPNYSPRQFADLDEQLEAQLDALREAGTAGWSLCEDALHNDGPEDFFVAAVLAAADKAGRLLSLVERSRRSAEVVPGLASALGWIGLDDAMQAAALLAGCDDPLCRRLVLEACGAHRRDPGPALGAALSSSSTGERARALRLAGELGQVRALPAVSERLGDDKTEARFWAAWSAVLLGDRRHAPEVLRGLALRGGSRQREAFRLALLCLPEAEAHRLLVDAEQLPGAERLRIIGAGFAGQPRYVPWLIEQMAQPALARIAGEAFVLITGADFNLDQLEALPPEGFEDGPSDDPEDEDVEVPEDIALPWPDVERVKAWWMAHRPRFDTGHKYFMGQPPTPEHGLQVLRTGYQRQRVIAAHYGSLLQPGTVLFPTSAPAWRQQRLLPAA